MSYSLQVRICGYGIQECTHISPNCPVERASAACIRIKFRRYRVQRYGYVVEGWKAPKQNLDSTNSTIITHAVRDYVRRKHLFLTKSFNDCSKSDNEMGAAVVIPVMKVKLSKTLLLYGSSFSAEIYGINLALKWIKENDSIEDLILWNCALTALKTINNYDNHGNELALSAQRPMQDSIAKEKSTTLIQIPMHSNKVDNDQAERLARRAASRIANTRD